MLRLSFLLFLFIPLVVNARTRLQPASIEFRYQSYAQSRASLCDFKKSDIGLHEWDVHCETEFGTRTYHVHLVLHYYSKTTFGGSGYELLYWVTDNTHSKISHDSITHWTHLPEPGTKVRVIQAFLGVENDLASLQLQIKLTP